MSEESRTEHRQLATMHDPSVSVVLLCAGRSTRTRDERNHKLLSKFDNITLVRRSALVARNSIAARIFAVTGSMRDAMTEELADIDVTSIYNPAFASGIAGSIIAGWKHSYECGYQGCMIMLADMPLISTINLNRLIEAFIADAGRSIASATCDSQPGNPVILPRNLNDEVLRLQGDVGARKLISNCAVPVLDIDIGPAALVDVDTPDEIVAAGGIMAFP